jgi:hypothetical protein
MNVLRGAFFSTAFQVVDEQAFATDPAILEMQKHVDMFAGNRDGEMLHCITSKGLPPQTLLTVRAPAILGLLGDARSTLAMEDPANWIAALQKHLHPDFGIVIDETAGDEMFMTYIMTDRAGWTRK